MGELEEAPVPDGTSDTKQPAKDLFRCDVFMFNTSGSTERTLQCILQAFENQEQVLASQTLVYDFEISVTISESDPTVSALGGRDLLITHQTKDTFKLKIGMERQITVVLTQTSKQQVIVQQGIGLLVGQGKDSSSATATELISSRVRNNSIALTGTWTAPDILK